ncbi:flagellar hook-length control protein FliK [Curtobacterium sp. YC1]|uniref:flagellar hook-length control protein FliK n=1 Tax=Curtobacterium sp. YC1 TaxID=2795488 RepID=UPI0018E598CC|nr:flagellar hook-length control protein FliK [Curtobacterium sp. YC1]QQD77545.1 flagellar hook-length control protein FliK [Curtobacterium sp. YC1]
MSMTIATQPSVPTAAGTTRGPAADPAAAGTFGAALTAAVATERQTGDGARQRDDTDGTTPEASTAVPLGTRTGTSGTAAGAPATTPDPSDAAGEAMPAGAPALLVAGLVTTPVAPTAPSTGDAGDRPAAGTPDPSAEDPRAVVVSAVVADATPTAPAGVGGPGSPVVATPASAPVPAAAGITAASTAAAATATATATVAAGTAQQGSSVDATPAAVAATTSATTTTTAPGSPAATAPAPAPALAATATDTAGTAPAPAASPTSSAPAALTTVPTRADDGVTVVSTPVVVAAAAAPAAGTAPRTGHATEQQVSTPGDPGLLAVAPTRGGETPAVVSTTPTTASAAPTPSAPAPLAQQLARPVFSLAQAGPGEHVVTVQVVPDTLGPVTVRAHVTAHGMHVELFAASDAGREAVRQVLPDLRRDAASAGGSTTLDLSSQNQPRDPSGRDERPAARALPGDTGLEARVAPRAQPTTSTPSIRTAGLDVLA